ncbi:hypothetical protein D3C80_1977300 [compost metagenome]
MVCRAMAVARCQGLTSWVRRLKDGATHHTEKNDDSAHQRIAVGTGRSPSMKATSAGQHR